MSNRIWVKAPVGLVCPKHLHGLIGQKPVEVPDLRYYRRMVKEGSLIEVSAPSEKKRKKAEVTHDSK